MQGTSSLQDWRGIDIGQIRAQLRLSTKDRVQVMVEAANRMIELPEHARVAREARAG